MSSKPAHRLLDFHFQDDVLDPHRAYKLMAGATAYAGGVSGMAVEAMASRVPAINWSYYDPIALDQPGFRDLRQALWIDRLWAAEGRYYRLDQGDWPKMVQMLDTTGPWPRMIPSPRVDAVVGWGHGSSRRVLEAANLI